MLDDRTTIRITVAPPLFKAATVHISADCGATEEERQEVLDMVCEMIRHQLGWKESRRSIHDGLSSDCKLGPIALAMAIDGEHPCDRCNHDRRECRGFPPVEPESERQMYAFHSFGQSQTYGM